MKEFLRQVAEHYYESDLKHHCFIFPNRRSLVFFQKYFAETLVANDGRTVFMPQMLTMNDFFYTSSGSLTTDRVHLLLILYECYKTLNPKAEPLDDFIFWGDVLLSDFDDVDKYLVDPRQLFTNVTDYKSIQDNLSYLTDNQKAAILKFLDHFRKGGKLTVDISAQSPDIKEKFLLVWELLYPLYVDFNKALDKVSCNYEGKVYRKLADSIKHSSVSDVLKSVFADTDKYVFVGLNALNECEKYVMSRMKDAGMAEFCWDFSGEWICDSSNKSSFFMKDNLSRFPQAFDIHEESLKPSINVVSLSSSVGQAKLLPSILEKISAQQYCGDMSSMKMDTAIVLPDENLLLPVLNSIPSEIEDINVTMGYPMSSSEFFSFMSEVAALQMHLRLRNGKWYFYHRQVWALFSNSILRSVLSEAAMERMKQIKAASQYYIPMDDLLNGMDDKVMTTLFKPVVKDPKMMDALCIRDFQNYQTDIISVVSSRLISCEDMLIELEFAKSYYQQINGLKQLDLPLLPTTYVRLLTQLVSSVSVPFKGEPLKGLQIMGPLETRSLDFKNMIVLSCNEGVFPRRSVSSSFIPPELRKAFMLPTYEFQDAVWAYYFYRMIGRVEQLWLLTDSRTENLKSGEESRYIKQLELHLKADIVRYIATSDILKREESGDIVKTPEDLNTLRNTFLSASAMQNYLVCPAKFYYHTIKKLVPEDEVSESLDAGMLGNVFHNTMQAIYFGEAAMAVDFSMDRKHVESVYNDRMRIISADYIKSWLGRKEDIKARIRSLIMTELHSFEISGKNLVFEDVILQYVLKVLERDLELIEDYGGEAFEIIGLEMKKFWEFHGFKFIGYLDRVDSFRKGEVRVVDYKTGKVLDGDVNINDENAELIVSALFNPEATKRPKIAFQLFLYDMFMREGSPADTGLGEYELHNSIYSPSKLFVSGVESFRESGKFKELMKEQLEKTLDEISDLDVPFKRTTDTKSCGYCDFKSICGR